MLNGSESDQLVTLRRHVSLNEAEVLKSLLEANGVPVFLSSRHMAYTYAAIQTDLKVRLVDQVRADHVLANISAIGPKAPRVAVEDDLACPTCGSSLLTPVIGKLDTAIPFVTLDAGPDDRWFRCAQCNTRFQDVPKKFASAGIAAMWALTLGGLTLGVIWFIQWIRLL